MFLVAMGTLFALQGAGWLMWPADSVMLARREWVPRGLTIAVAGVLMMWWAARRKSG